MDLVSALAPQPLRFGALLAPSRHSLAPLAGYTTWAFRLSVRELGGLGLATTDLVNPRALLQRSKKSLELIATTPADQPLAVQLYGQDAGEMAAAAQWLESEGAAVIDLNMGCPVAKVVRGGGGSAMLCSPVETNELVRRIVAAVRIPVTVKMRLGWDAASHSAPYFAAAFEKLGVAAVTVHGRTREQGFRGAVDLDGIRKVVEAVDAMPIIGNGDVRSLADADRMFETTGCAGVAIGRGALLNPWIFRQLAEQETFGEVRTQPGYGERLEFMARHFHRLKQDRGEWHACLNFRKVANWHCRVLKPGRAIQQQLVMIESVGHFDAIVGELRDRLATQGPPRNWKPDAEIPVPSGPIDKW